jgi:hypothetical protein
LIHSSVCPYTRPSINNECFVLALAGGEHDVQSIDATVDRYREWFVQLFDETEEARQHLLTILVVLPGLDHLNPDPLDALQARLKDRFVREGLMVGQFHPRNDQGGLWNKDFRPLRAPIPLLSIRRMVPSDLAFLIDSADHVSAYLDQLTPRSVSAAAAERAAQPGRRSQGVWSVSRRATKEACGSRPPAGGGAGFRDRLDSLRRGPGRDCRRTDRRFRRRLRARRLPRTHGAAGTERSDHRRQRQPCG